MVHPCGRDRRGCRTTTTAPPVGPMARPGGTRNQPWAPAGKGPEETANGKETANGNHETDCHSWGFGPQIGDRSSEYKGHFQAFSGLSYKGSIRQVTRRALGSGEQLATLQSQPLRLFTYNFHCHHPRSLVGSHASPGPRKPAECRPQAAGNRCDGGATQAWAMECDPGESPAGRGPGRADAAGRRV